MQVVAVSGGFSLGLCHIGHLAYLEGAKKLGGKLMVILNTDEWIERKYGWIPLEYQDRERILRSCRFVDDVVPQIDTDDTVAKSLLYYHPDIFAKAGDRILSNIPKNEIEACEFAGIKIVYVQVSKREMGFSTSLLMQRIVVECGYT